MDFGRTVGYDAVTGSINPLGGAGKAGKIVGMARGANKLGPNPSALEPHTVFKRSPSDGGPVSNYETFRPQTNPRNPNPWESEKGSTWRERRTNNKKTREHVPTPHAQGPGIPGGVRPATPDDIPRR